ncbi:hypothetical protein [Nocardia sp. NPDC050710]|uniref:hypothetical protein n=1 Tax=Nocardia sp. NPDC050710 TaxID=3157220 RepID=UPI0033EDF37C
MTSSAPSASNSPDATKPAPIVQTHASRLDHLDAHEAAPLGVNHATIVADGQAPT